MKKLPKISLILPCRNESAHIEHVVKDIPKSITEIVIVDNLSRDDTAKVVKKIAKGDTRVRYIAEPRQKNGIGYGFAIMCGLQSARGEWCVVADGDGTYPFSDIKPMLEFACANKLDFVSGARYPVSSGGGSLPIPLKLRMGVGALNLWVRILYGHKFADILSGMMMIRRADLSRLSLDAGDWNMSPQLKLEARKNLQAGEFHISQQDRLGKTKQNYMRTGLSHMWWIFKNRWRKERDSNPR